ncbi:MAG: toluene-4-monooxygenase system B family protein [Hydrogenibacillus schlegelii]|uniref:Toluene-4-monooxygenase system B family protein n=1 Tax=Hydrogenibacillus schlegelii TaxID=1484 RepID=A0A947GHD3_HYDSH|nr:toluene-4-monooxygenase system B family protein [Hydrogenibacillus schlegelii]
MATVPLAAAHKEDFVVLVVPVEDTDTIAQVAQKIAVHTVGIRVKPRNKPLQVMHNGRVVPDHLTVAEAGIRPMDYVEVSYVE